MTEPATLVQLIRQVRAQRQATDALEGERLRLEGSLIEFVEEAWPYVDAGMGVRMMRQGTRRAFSGNDPILAPSAAHRPQAIAKVGWFFGIPVGAVVPALVVIAVAVGLASRKVASR